MTRLPAEHLGLIPLALYSGVLCAIMDRKG